MKSTFAGCIDIHHSWFGFFTHDMIARIVAIEEAIGDDFNPLPHEVLRFAATDLQNRKVIILGQDPYPQKGVPSGRSFEVRGLNSWHDKFKQSSLRNILRNIYRSYTGELKTLNHIRGEIAEGRFHILPPDRLFDHWESEGVLMLNTFLTCKVGEPGSHRHLWKPVTDELIRYMVKNNPDITWFLWGKESQAYVELLSGSKIYKSNHPMLPGKGEPEDFIACDCFKDTISIGIDWLGQTKRV